MPLITHDPFFSVWSFADKLTDDETRHWNGVRKYMVGVCFAKTDWQMWSTRLFDNPEYTGMVADAMWRYLCKTPDRVPFSDLNFVSVPIMRGFQARTVQAGLFINLLQF